MKEREEGVQARIIEALELCGYRVLQTSRRRRPCVQCGHTDTRGDGVSKGLADLMVRHMAWPVPCLWFAVEVKGPTTKVSPEQAELEKLGACIIVRRDQDALTLVQLFEVRQFGKVYGRSARIGA